MNTADVPSRAEDESHSSPWAELEHEAALVDTHVREGRFQRSLALLAGVSSLMTGLEVGYQHYRGSYSRRIMYSPVVLSGVLAAAGAAAFFSKRASRIFLRPVAILTLGDGLLGFYFHVRGIARKPGGWRFPMTNMVMGPPVFAPLLFGISAYLGLIASYLRREDAPDQPPNPLAQNDLASKTVAWIPRAAHEHHWMTALPGDRISKPEHISLAQDLREGRFQNHMAAATALAAFFSGFEAFYSHYKNNFSYKVQWTPVVLSPLLIAASLGAMKNRKAAHRLLPAVAAAAVLDGGIGFFYHARGVVRRPGGMKHLLYNIMYGPPVLAPLLFGACGMLGLMASLFRREK